MAVVAKISCDSMCLMFIAYKAQIPTKLKVTIFLLNNMNRLRMIATTIIIIVQPIPSNNNGSQPALVRNAAVFEIRATEIQPT